MIKSILKVGLVIALTGFTLSCNNKNKETKSQFSDEIEAVLDGLHEDGKLNGNVLVLKEGNTIVEKSYGYANGNKTTPLTKDHRFNIGSIYKEFPAVAIMQLQEQNRLQLDDTLSSYVPNLPTWSDTITIKQLLQYSTGLPRIPWEMYFTSGEMVTEKSLLQGLQDIEALQFKPGTDYLYSNNNPILVMKIVEAVSQLTFNEYVEQHLFEPLDMSATVIKDQYPYKDKTLMALPFDSDFKVDEYELAVNSLLFHATARDLTVWFEQLGDFKVVNKASVKALSETAKSGEYIQAPLGRCDWKNDDILEQFHHGSSGNYECVVRRFKQEDITIAILTNQKNRNVIDISEDIYELLKNN